MKNVDPFLRLRLDNLETLLILPSAKNSGFDKIANRTFLFLEFAFNTLVKLSAVRTGTVDFSMMIFGDSACSAILRDANSLEKQKQTKSIHQTQRERLSRNTRTLGCKHWNPFNRRTMRTNLLPFPFRYQIV